MIALDRSLVIQIVNFVFLIWILNIVLYKPIRKVLLQRKEKISGLEKSIQTSLRDATEKDESIAAGIKLARENGLKQREALLNEAEAEEKEIIQAVHRKAQEDLAAIREKIISDADKVRVSLQQEIDGFARAISQKILGRPIL